MTRRDVLGLAWANLNRMRARVALTAIGVIIGTAAVIVLISLGVGLQSSAEAELGGVGDLTVIEVNSFGGGMVAMGPGGRSGGGDEAVLDDRALADIREIPEVVAATPRMWLEGAAEMSLGRMDSFGSPQGIDPEALQALAWELDAGSLRLTRGQILIGKNLFENDDFGMMMRGGPGPRGAVRVDGGGGSGRPEPEPLAPEELVGRTVTLRLIKFDDEGNEIARAERLRVAGVLASDNESRSAYVSLQQAIDYNNWLTGTRRNARDGYQSALVKVAERSAVSDVQAAIDEMGFNSFSMQQILESMNQVFLIMQAVLGGVGAIALLVAAFGIANTMTMAIYERTKEIGIMKAIGANNNDVLQIFLSEAAAIGFAGGLFGVAIGWGLGWVIDFYVRNVLLADQAANAAPGDPVNHIVVTPWWLMAFALVFATLVGLISGTYPALRAASMKPLRALRTD